MGRSRGQQGRPVASAHCSNSTLDRYADGCLLLGVLFYFTGRDQMLYAVIAGVALIGTYTVSYVRARGEGLGVRTRDGIFTRFERTIVLIAALLTGWLVPGVIILAIGTQITALQRLITLYRLIKTEDRTQP